MLMSLTNSTLRVIYVIPLVHFISCILDGDAACGGQRLEKTALCVPGLWLWLWFCPNRCLVSLLLFLFFFVFFWGDVARCEQALIAWLVRSYRV